MEDITDSDCMHAKGVNKNLWEFHDMCVQSDMLLLADVFKNFQNIFLKIYELFPARFLTAPGLAWQTALEKTKIRLDLVTDIGILLMVEKR